MYDSRYAEAMERRGFSPHIPLYYRDDFNIAIALLKNEAYLKQQLNSRLAQPAQAPETGALEGAFQRGITHFPPPIRGSSKGVT